MRGCVDPRRHVSANLMTTAVDRVERNWRRVVGSLDVATPSPSLVVTWLRTFTFNSNNNANHVCTRRSSHRTHSTPLTQASLPSARIEFPLQETDDGDDARSRAHCIQKRGHVITFSLLALFSLIEWIIAAALVSYVSPLRPAADRLPLRASSAPTSFGGPPLLTLLAVPCSTTRTTTTPPTRSGEYHPSSGTQETSAAC